MYFCVCNTMGTTEVFTHYLVMLQSYSSPFGSRGGYVRSIYNFYICRRNGYDGDLFEFLRDRQFREENVGAKMFLLNMTNDTIKSFLFPKSFIKVCAELEVGN